MAFFLKAHVFGKHAGQHARHGIGEDHGGQLAARQDKIADRDFLHVVFLQNALIHTLIMPAKHDDILVFGELLHFFLV